MMIKRFQYNDLEVNSLNFGKRFFLYILLGIIGINGIVSTPCGFAEETINEQDLIYPLSQMLQDNIAKRYEKSGYMVDEFSVWSEITSPALNRLFPEYRFLSIKWTEKIHPDYETGGMFGVGYGLHAIFACRKDAGSFVELSGYGNYEEYGKLLAETGTQLNREEDARLIWDGFCDIHTKQWKDMAFEKISDKEWNLGVITINGLRYYYRVILNEEGKVLSGKMYAQPAMAGRPLLP